MKILGIETSCDETSVALLNDSDGVLRVVKNLVYSQIPIHRQYGGVVPEVAARHHVEKILPLIKEVVKLKPDAVAVTAGPGLATALLVGVETAKTLSYLLKIPLIRVNHIEGHIYANWLSSCHSGLNPESRNQQLLDSRFRVDDSKKFPALCLIVSGGHTELILMKKHLNYKLIGQTRDDAVGECFDKVGKILNLPYPGGPEVAKMAAAGNSKAIDFPRPMIDSPDFDFSFSGLKTAALYYLQNFARKRERPKQSQKNYKRDRFAPIRELGLAMSSTALADICASFQQAALDVLVAKTIRAAQKYKVKTILTGGGVAANLELQKQLKATMVKNAPQISFTPVNPKFCGDNAAMIAAAGYFRAAQKKFTPWQKIKIDPNWELV